MRTGRGRSMVRRRRRRGWRTGPSSIRRRVGRWWSGPGCCGGCPHLRQAYRDGVLGTAKVVLLLNARRDVEALFAEHEADLIELIRDLTVAQARVVVRRWRQKALESLGIQDDGPDPCDEANNSLHVSATLEGRREILGNLDAVNGAELEGHLEGRGRPAVRLRGVPGR